MSNTANLSIDEIPSADNLDAPGLYAWYHRIEFGDADIDACRRALNNASSLADRRTQLESFLLEHVFRPYQETDYRVDLSAKLKPRYSGVVQHQPRIDDTVLDRLVDDPSALPALRTALRAAVPIFSSPIYIGIAKKSLRARLLQHKALLEQFREREISADEAMLDADHSFAYEAICVRGFLPSELLVHVMPLDGVSPIVQVAEYVLNRINYPLCGRN